jgi:hypothetical protein
MGDDENLRRFGKTKPGMPEPFALRVLGSCVLEQFRWKS